MVEIEANETGWSGYMRLGLTQMNPSGRFALPAYSVPHFEEAAPGRSWIFPIHNSLDNLNSSGNRHRRNSNDLSSSSDNETSSASSDDSEFSPEEVELMYFLNLHERQTESIKSVPQSSTTSTQNETTSTTTSSTTTTTTTTRRRRSRNTIGVLPTDVGSRVGVMYKISGTKTADMHFILNGKDMGPKVVGIPYDNSPLYAIIDVYGITKKLRVVSEFSSLQSACLQVILSSLMSEGRQHQDLSQLPLPKKLRNILDDKLMSSERSG